MKVLQFIVPLISLGSFGDFHFLCKWTLNIIREISIENKTIIKIESVVVQDVPAGATCVMQNSRIIVKNQNA